MNSYLCNRHYLNLTQELPDQLRKEEPSTVYLNLFNSEKKTLTIDIPQKRISKFKAKKSKQISGNENIGDCCPICFSSENIEVEYYGKKHVCVQCRKLVRDQHGNQTKIFTDSYGQIVCLGVKAENTEKAIKTYYYTDYTRLQINNRSAFATFGKEDQMVVLLREGSLKKDLLF